MAVAEVGPDGIIVIAPQPDVWLGRLPVAWGTQTEVEAKVRRWATLDPDGTRRVPGWTANEMQNIDALHRFRGLCADRV